MFSELDLWDYLGPQTVVQSAVFRVLAFEGVVNRIPDQSLELP